MSWRFELITCNVTGLITNRQNIVDVEGDFKLERTAGDEFYIKSGDITLKTREPLPIDTVFLFNFLLAYKTNSIGTEVLIDAFYVPRDYDDQDQKFNRYKTKLYSIQKIFFDNLATVTVEHETDTNLYGDALDRSYFDFIYRFDTGAGIGYLTATAFAVGSLVTELATYKPANGFAYRINSVSFPGIYGENDDVGLVHSGSPNHYPSTQPDFATLVSETFTGGSSGTGEIDMSNWLGVFKVAALMHNGFIVATPTTFIDSGNDYFGIDVVIKERAPASQGSLVDTRWVERTKQKDRFRIDGVFLYEVDGETEFYTKGSKAGENVYKKTTPFLTGLETYVSSTPGLNLSVGDWDSGNSRYDIRDGSNMNRHYFGEDLVADYFDPLIDQGSGFKGKIIWDGQQLLDHVLVKYGGVDTYVQISKLKLTRYGRLAEVEGFEIG